MMTKASGITIRQVAVWAATVMGVGALLFGLYELRDLLLLFFVGIVVSAALRPLVLTLQRYRVPKAGAVLLIYVSFLATLGIGAAMVMPSLAAELALFIDQAPARYTAAVAELQGSFNPVLRGIAGTLPPFEALAPMLSAATSGDVVLGLANSAANMATAFLTVLGVAFYWTMDQPRMERLWLSLARPAERPRLLAVWRAMESKMGAYLRGTVIVSVAIAVVTGLGYSAMGLKYALVLGVLAGLSELIPVVGFVVGLVPALLIALSQSPQLALMVLAWIAVVQFGQNTVFMPRIMSDAVGVSPLVILFALLAFGQLFGPMGALMAIPLAGIIQVLLDHFLVNESVEVDEAVPEAAPLLVARRRVRAVRERIRQRLRARGEYLDVSVGADAVDQRIEAIVENVDRAIANVSAGVEVVDQGVVLRIEEALEQVDLIGAELRAVEAGIASADEVTQVVEASVEEVDSIILEARSALAEAAAHMQVAAETLTPVTPTPEVDEDETEAGAAAPPTPVVVPSAAG